MKEHIKKILDISDKTYYNWKNQNRPIIELLYKYFTDSEIEEFLQTGEIINFETTNYIKYNFMKINKDKYIQNFKSISLSIRSIYEESIKDFYFYFLSNLKNKKNFFSSTDYEYESNLIEKYDFNKALSDYIFKNQEKEFEKGNFDKRLLYVKEKLEKEHTNFIEFTDKNFSNEDNARSKTDTFNFDEEKEKQNLIKEIIEHSQKQFEHIYNHLSFIQYWDNDMYFFINYLIKTDFELFINSNNDELLYHAIGFLVYSNNNFQEEDILYDNKISVVNEIYGYFSENKNEINKELIKEISLKFEKLDEFKNYKRISEYLKKINKELSKEEIYKIILEPKKLEKINKEIEEFERNKFGEKILENLISEYKS
ncbi:hypothetical protein [Aliarcobacter cryaerophilus]|uniref:hypothetical protein n=1 Tax=Aliarcobacter cryaerophilus TaxID=28198 RepID=UPI0021B5F1F9|nr:hypothetical protein [Aliarcobacter cryaerophilus]MCT7472945.1 hypothetical protein [Aliarcobacter cryaerophilus]